jgi:hypothetical protein
MKIEASSHMIQADAVEIATAKYTHTGQNTMRLATIQKIFCWCCKKTLSESYEFLIKIVVD